MGNAQPPLLAVRGLTIALPAGGDRLHAVADATFEVAPGQILCVVGESGSGKSMTAQAIMGLLPTGCICVAGQILLNGRDLLRQTPAAWRATRGREIGMIFQEPMTALNPSMRIGDQIGEMFAAHTDLPRIARRNAVLALVREVGLPDAAAIVSAYPHQLSGGQRQRAMIAMTLALEPAVLVADEPTTALDVTTQAQILALIRTVQRRRSMGVVFITHDLGVVSDIADHVVVMRGGEIVERGSAAETLRAPVHGYTRSLLAAVPSLTPPARDRPKRLDVALQVDGLDKTFRLGGGLFVPRRVVAAVQAVSFEIARGETLGLVGESGSGKSTVARLAVRLAERDGGTIRLGPLDFSALAPRALRRERRRIQMVFQDPYASLNPRRTIGNSLAAGPIAHGEPRPAAHRRVRDLLSLVGLEESAFDRYPAAFSGGQRQRIGIARALAMEPDVIVADEAVSALDVSVQAQILALLQDLKSRLQIAMLFITHDLRVAAQICDRIAVMQGGRIVEIKDAAELYANAEHPYTRRLIEAIPGRSGLIERAPEPSHARVDT